MTFTRRVFLRWSALTSAALGALPAFRRRLGAQAAPTGLKGLESTRLVPIARLVLPPELGEARIDQAAMRFAQWIAGFKPGEETVHPYGSERLGVTGASPAPAWIAQLDALDRSAVAADPNRLPFHLTTPGLRKRLLDDALAAAQLTARVPSAIAAPHVAIALLAHWLDSAEARNLAYGRVIDPQTCRPLAASPRQPVALQRSVRTG
jgi:hypothetical protein